MNYLVLRTFFDAGVKYYMYQIITISDTNYANSLIQWGAITQAPAGRVARSYPPGQIIIDTF